MHARRPLVTDCGDINCSRYAVTPLHAHLPQLALEMFDVGLTHRGKAMLFDQLRDSQKALPNVLGKRTELPLDTPVEDFNAPAHSSEAYLKKEMHANRQPRLSCACIRRAGGTLSPPP
jgi:hypothetical protein